MRRWKVEYVTRVCWGVGSWQQIFQKMAQTKKSWKCSVPLLRLNFAKNELERRPPRKSKPKLFIHGNVLNEWNINAWVWCIPYRNSSHTSDVFMSHSSHASNFILFVGRCVLIAWYSLCAWWMMINVRRTRSRYHSHPRHGIWNTPSPMHCINDLMWNDKRQNNDMTSDAHPWQKVTLYLRWSEVTHVTDTTIRSKQLAFIYLILVTLAFHGCCLLPSAPFHRFIIIFDVSPVWFLLMVRFSN